MLSFSLRSRRAHVVAPLALLYLAVTGCGGAAAPPPGDHAGDYDQAPPAGEINPDTCGNYQVSDTGRKIYAFLQATVWLQDEVQGTEEYLHETCHMMADALGMPRLAGTTQEVCGEVLAELDDSLEAGLSARASLEVDYQPAVCEVNIDAAAHAAADCEGRATADVQAQCHGECQGTCQGYCDGECVGDASADGGGGQAGGECHGECRGTCEGTCTGTCAGYADVEAEASCQAHAEIRANTEATCTEPELSVSYDAELVADTARLESALAAIDAGLPRVLGLHARLTGPVRGAFTTWAAAAADLGQAGVNAVRDLGDSAICVAGQLAAAAAAIAAIEASISVQVEVSASASGSIGGGTI